MKKLLSNPNGFTLVELMVVVAIIGILSAVAIPNFKKYQAKSKQSEAKIQLAALYSAEIATSADYDTYGTCLTLMGYETNPRGYYTIGFTTGYDASAKFPTCIATATPKLAPTDHQSANGAVNLTLPASTAAQITFTAAAAGQISTGNTTDDVWTVTQTKAFVNVPSL